MTSKDELGIKIGEAWKAHYAGQDAVALEKFQQLAEQHPDHVDVLWGLGLTYRKAGDFEHAVQVFEQVKALVSVKVDPHTQEYERYFMLKRMVEQQLSQVDKFLD